LARKMPPPMPSNSRITTAMAAGTNQVGRSLGSR
jgi:hypothetical protein